ncbi:CopD family protein [Geodermatophilus sp. DSM 45219]|uniref:CopD family protein n=1 Tax=Geodermatophilus sp. DSM 45219 TaxID=1881103 RepID=UPI000B86AFB8|nr:CopD family protein [Geodermatophilus sp. DSM 45219]
MAPTSVVEASLPRPPVRTSAVPVVVAAVAGLLGVLVLALLLGGGRPAEAAAGLAQAGPLVSWGLPVATLAGRIAAVGTVGTLLFAAVLLPGSGRSLPQASRRALRAASRWALGWAAATVAGALLTVAQLVGVAPTAVTASSLRVFATDLPAGRSAVVVLVATVVVALTARRCAGSVPAALLLAAAVCGLVMPAVLTGHSSAAEDHVLAVTNLSVHVVAASLWVGGLLALLVHGRSADGLAGAVGRFSALALVCFAAAGTSGVLAAWLVLGGSLPVDTVLGSGYGWLLLGKTAALVVLGVLGRRHRRSALPRLRSGRPGAFRRFAAVEAAVMLATVALAVALAASPPPAAAAVPAAATATPGEATTGTAAPEPGAAAVDDMSGHDHGDLSVTVLVDGTRFHVSSAVAPGSRVTLHNGSATEVSLTADDGSFDVVVPGRTLTTFLAPSEPGSYPFTSRHSAGFADVLVVG